MLTSTSSLKGLKGLFLGATCGLLLTTGVGCGGDTTDMTDPMNQMPDKCTADKVTGNPSKYASDSLRMPSGNMTYASDIDGNMKAENKIKDLINAVMLAKLDIQGPVDQAVKDGQAVLLAELMTPDLVNAGCASLSLAMAKPPEMGAQAPSYDGSDTFKPDAMQIKLYGKIENGKLSTTPSKDQTAEDEQRIALELPFGNGNKLPLKIRGVHIEGTVTTNKAGQPIIQNGAIHGVVSQKDIDAEIIPTVARLITKQINDNPMESNTALIISLFESMENAVTKNKCAEGMGEKCCATHPMTCVILPEEVKISQAGGVLSSDVQVFDDNDKWKPVPGGKMKNGMSIGLGFSAVKASF